MYRILIVCIVLACSTPLAIQKIVPNNKAKHFQLDEVGWSSISKSEPSFGFKNPDTTITHQMHLLSNKDGMPILYYADIQTPVCIDGLCKPVYIELFWDLLGNYVGYGDYPNELLTKFDHDLFEQKDYLKLHELLMDQNSVIGRRRLSQLYDKNVARTETIKFKGVEVDAISGATRKEIKESIVEGGLYSCYTLWHLVHGPAASNIKSLVPSLYSESVADYFLKSNYKAYQLYALQKMDASHYNDNVAYVIPAVKDGSPITRSYLLKKMPKDLFKNPLAIDQLYNSFSDFDFNARTLLLDNLSHSAPAALVPVSKHLSMLSKNQVRLFLDAVSELDAVDLVEDELKSYAGNRKYDFGSMVGNFLNDNS